jgi:ABC-type transport system involved in cytochrome bd biosynthesis fused ATPase/permease subunit
LVNKLRVEELAVAKRTATLRVFNLTIFYALTQILSYISFMVYSGTGHTVTAYRVFATMAMFNAMRLPMGLNFPLAVQSLAEVRVVFNRLRDFYALPEAEPVVDFSDMANTDKTAAVVFSNVSCAWTSPDRPTLVDLNLCFRKGQLVVSLRGKNQILPQKIFVDIFALLRSRWLGRSVVAKRHCLWPCWASCACFRGSFPCAHTRSMLHKRY